jgi:Ras-related protein Rab-1A
MSTSTQNNNVTTSGSQKIAKKLSKSKQFDYTFKIVMIGDSGVGKSCILLRFADDKFNENFYATIGVDFRFKNVMVDDKSVKLQIWDTAGQERFKTITSAYYRGADGIIIVYDITDRNSFAHIKDWLDDVNKYTDDNPLKIIVGNKIDLIKDKQINNNDMKTMTAQTGIEIIECSAKDSIKINELMEIMTKKLIEKKKNEGNKNTTKSMILNDINNKNKELNNKGCC